MKRYVREAMALVDAGKQIGPARKMPVVVPEELEVALMKNSKAQRQFTGLAPGRQREHADFTASAKRSGTKQSRLDKILPMINAGIGLNDRYRR